MSENFDSQVVYSENIPAQQKISFIENFKTHFFSLPPKKRAFLIVVAALVLWLFFSLLSVGSTADPIDIVKNSYLSGYPNATMGEILDAGGVNEWSSQQSNEISSLYTVTASSQYHTLKFLVDVKENAWQLISFKSGMISIPVSEVGNYFFNGWYIAAQRQ